MFSGNHKSVRFTGAIFCLLFVATWHTGLCDEEGEDAAQSPKPAATFPVKATGDIGNAHGLDRLKLLAALRKQNGSPAAPGLHASTELRTTGSEEKLQDERTGRADSQTHPGSSTHIKLTSDEHDTKPISHDVKLRSNSSSPALTSFSDRPNKRPLGGAGLLSKTNSNSSSGVHEQISHDHTVKFRVNPNSEEDSAEDASFKAPVSGVGTHGISGDSEAAPIRPAGGARPIGSNANRNNNAGLNRIVQIKKPLPVVRQESADNHDDSRE